MALNEKIIRKCAKSIVDSCNLAKGDGVIVKGGAHNQTLLEEIAFGCYAKGATPTIVVSSDRYTKRIYDEIPATILETTPKQYLGLVKAADMLISIEEIDDPAIAKQFPRKKIQARQKASTPIMDVIFDSRDGKKWLYAGWPTRAAAKFYGVPYSALEKTIIGGISVPPKRLMEIGKRIDGRLKDASWAHVWDDKGTDFKIKIEGRRRNIDDGFISDSDYRDMDRGNNLPGGELFIAPHETVGSGKMYCPVTTDRISEKILKDVYLEFRNGKILLDKTTARKDTDVLRASFRECEEIDRTRYDPVRTRNLAELGIGFNPNITKAFGYILTDEKVAGTVHLAFGSNNTYGGTSESTMHWDFVSAPGVNLEVETARGKTVQVIKKGRFV